MSEIKSIDQEEHQDIASFLCDNSQVTLEDIDKDIELCKKDMETHEKIILKLEKAVSSGKEIKEIIQGLNKWIDAKREDIEILRLWKKELENLDSSGETIRSAEEEIAYNSFIQDYNSLTE